MAERPVAPTAPELVLATDTGSRVLSPGRDYHLGRDPLSDIVLDDARVYGGVPPVAGRAVPGRW